MDPKENSVTKPDIKKRICIIGGTSGIGLGLVKEYVSQNVEIIVTGRDDSQIKQLLLYSPTITFIKCDITDKQDLENFKLFLIKQNLPINLLILNSGTCEYLDKNNFNTDIFRRTFEVNFFGLITCLEICLPFLKIVGNPHVAIMSSTVAYFGLPRAEAYGSSKSALRYLGQSLQAHWYKFIDVSIICPGFVKTPLTDKNDFPMPMRVSSEWAAKYIRTKLDKRQLEISFPFMFVVILKIIEFLPNSLRVYVTAKLDKK